MSQTTGPRPIIPELLRYTNSFAVSAARGRDEVMVFFEVDHPGAPGQIRPVAQLVMSPELLRRIHSVFGTALEHLGVEDGAEAVNVEDLPANVRPFPRRVTAPAHDPEG